MEQDRPVKNRTADLVAVLVVIGLTFAAIKRE